MAFTRILLLLYFVAVAFDDKASSLSIVSSESFTVGSPVTIRCSADAIDLVSTGDKYYSVRLSRRTYSSTNENSLNDKEELFLLDVGILIEDGGTKTYIFKYPKGSGWDIQFPTEQELLDQKYQRGVLFGELTIPETTCQDSGHYFCEVVYREIRLQTIERVQELNGSVSASAISANIVPDNIDDQFETNRSVEMRCNAEGPEDYTFFWEISCPSSFQVQQFVDYSPQNDIQNHEKEPIPSDPCGVYRHNEELKFLMSSDRDECMIRCQFGQFRGGSENIMQNHTFYLKEEPTAPSVNPTNSSANLIPGTMPGKASSSSSASNKDLVIGLTVSLLLVAIIVAAVLVYVCWWRKRQPSQDKYKDEPDVGADPGNHAPPPVFYSKPNKPPKNDARGDPKENEKWNSRDRNASYDDDDELPPKAYYYDNNEQEDNRDRNNDDEEPPKQKYSSSRPRGRRRSQRGSGDYHNYDNSTEDYPHDNSRRSYGDGPTPYATSTDFSRSEDESEPGRPRPKPKRRTKLPSSSSRDFEEPPKEKELHYADLDLSKKSPRKDGGYDDRSADEQGRYNRNRRNRKSRGHEDEEENMPVQYASIRV